MAPRGASRASRRAACRRRPRRSADRYAASAPTSSGRAGEHGLSAALAEPRARVVGELEVGAEPECRAPPPRARPRARPSETSWTSEHRGAARQRNSTSAPRPRGRAAPARRRARPNAPGTPSPRARPASAPASTITSPSRQPPGTARTSVDEPDAADDGRRVDRAAVGLVVERHVPGDDRNAQRLAGLRHPLDRLGELPGDLALLGVAEVEAVGEPERLAAGAGDVARRLEHGERAACSRLERADPARGRRARPRAREAGPQPQHRGVEPRPAHRARADELVVAPVDPRAAADVRRGEQLEQRVGAAGAVGRAGQAVRPARRRLDRVARALVGEAAAPGSRRRPRLPRRAGAPVSVTSPITACWSSQRSQTASTASSICGRTTATIRSWLSEIIISHGSIPSSRSGTRSRWRSIPPSRAISESDEASPAAPQSCSDSTRPFSTSSTETSISFLPVNGSPICTVGRLSASPSPSSWLASTDAPPIPSRPVVAP